MHLCFCDCVQIVLSQLLCCVESLNRRDIYCVARYCFLRPPSNRQHQSDTGEQGISKFATNQVKDRPILTRNFGDACTAMAGDFDQAAGTGDSKQQAARARSSKPTFDHQRHPQKNKRCTGVIPRVFAIIVQQ